MNAQKTISKMFPDMLTIVYTGEGITARMGEKSSHRKTSISDILQDIKNKFIKITHIIIFAGELAGRGISFKSKDRSWHLTDEFLIVAKKCGEPEIMQKIRIAGRYQDDIPLTLFTTDKIILDLRRAYYRQEECIFETKKEDNKDKICTDILSGMIFSKSKMTSRPIFKDVNAKHKLKFKVVHGNDNGLSMSVYDGKELLPDSFYNIYKTTVPSEEERNKFKEDNDKDDDDKDNDDKDDEDDEENNRLINKMFRKWENDESKISRFLHNINPDIIYSKNEFKELCQEYSIGLSDLFHYGRKRGQSKGYGKIFEEYKNGYRIRPVLLKEFKKYF
jgi:hypothetical protein